MSLKAIDLQQAVTRSSNVGELQHQLTNKALDDQAQLAASAQRAAELDRKRNVKLNEKADMMIQDDDPHEGKGKQGASKDESNQEDDHENELAKHPFKGKHIDLSL